MAWSGMTRTNQGRRLYAGCLTTGTFRVTKVVLGDGYYTGSYADITAVVSQKLVFEGQQLRVFRSEDKTVVEVSMSGAQIQQGFYFRELALFATDGTDTVLYVYDNCGADAEYISPDTPGHAFDDRVRIDLITSDAASIHVHYDESTYVPSDGGDLADTVITFTDESGDVEPSDIVSGSTTSGIIATIKKILSDLASAITGKYTLPDGGIPKTDLASAVQTSLGKADTAYQKASSGIPASDMASAVQTSLGKADTAYQKASSGIPKTDLASAVQTSLGKADSAATTTTYTATIPATSWTGSAAPFYKDVTVSGITSTDTPIIDIVQTGTKATDETMRENWGKITRITTDTNKIRVYADEKPSANIPIQIKCVR